MQTEKKLEAAYKYFNKANESKKNGDFITAIQNYRLSISNFPTIDAHLNLSSVLGKKGKYKEAIEECFSALNIDSTEHSTYNYIGYYLVKQKKYYEAKIWLDEALTFNENINKHLTYFNLGIVHEKIGDWYKSIEMFNNALKIKPDFKKATKNLILLSSRLN